MALTWTALWDSVANMQPDEADKIINDWLETELRKDEAHFEALDKPHMGRTKDQRHGALLSDVWPTDERTS